MVHLDRVMAQIKLHVVTAVLYLLPVMVIAPMTYAQEKTGSTAAGARNQPDQKNSGGTQKKQEEEPFPEVEFVASSDFRKFSLITPIYRNVNIEGYYFGIRPEPENEEPGEPGAEAIIDSGTINGSYSFRLWKGVVLTPGFGVAFGEGQKTSPAITFRWEIEKEHLFSEGLFILSLHGSEESGRESIWDGNHVSMRLNRFEFGPAWERLHARVGNEWKGGGRAAFRLQSNLSFVFFVFAPSTECRFGFIIHPDR